jgi:hypothetical protein
MLAEYQMTTMTHLPVTEMKIQRAYSVRDALNMIPCAKTVVATARCGNTACLVKITKKQAVEFIKEFASINELGKDDISRDAIAILHVFPNNRMELIVG